MLVKDTFLKQAHFNLQLNFRKVTMSGVVFFEKDELIKNLAIEKNNLSNLKERMKGLNIVLIEGDHSLENTLYTESAASEIRGILAIDKALSSMGMNYKRIKTTDKSLSDALNSSDFAFIYAQSEFGEDGRIQGWLDYLDVCYPGPGVSASALCCDKLYFKKVIKASGVNTANFAEITPEDNLFYLSRKASILGYPIIIKERVSGSSLGLTIVNNEVELSIWYNAIKKRSQENYFLEKFIKGKFFTVGIISMETGDYVLPVLSAETDAEFYDADMKLGKSDKEIKYLLDEYPASFNKRIKKYAWDAFRHTGCEGLARVDFMVSGDEIYVLEINTIPGVSYGGNFTQMFTSIGFSYEEMILAVMNTAYLKKNKYLESINNE